MISELHFDVVVPTAGRPSVARTLMALTAGEGPWPAQVVVVDDRPAADGPLPLGAAADALGDVLTVVSGPAAGPAAARNAGWRAGAAPWVAFLDDDVEPQPGWRAALAEDLEHLGPRVAGSQGRIDVPAPQGRRPTDVERGTMGLADARWATADMAYRRSALTALGGFDERFPRAYREDADLALRCQRRGWALVVGERRTTHPVAAPDPWISLRRQRGNADDQLMAALHGPGWRVAAGAPRGRLPRHAAVTAAGAVALALRQAGGRVTFAASRRGERDAPRLPAVAAGAGALWLAGTAEFAWRRIAPGPRTRQEVLAMLVTSAAIPPAAVVHALRGRRRRPALLRSAAAPRATPAALLFDRDATLVRDVPYNGDPDQVEPLPGVARALARVRAAGIPIAIVSNQSGIARGLLTREQVEAVNARVDALLGPFDAIVYCPHGPADRCACRKPAPGLVFQAAGRLGVDPAGCVLIGDIGADVGAARAAGARGILVPTPITRQEEVDAAPEVAADLQEAVGLALGDALEPTVRDPRRSAAAAAPAPSGTPAAPATAAGGRGRAGLERRAA